MPLAHAAVTSSRQLSEHSTEGVSDSLWFSTDFLLGAGTVIIQPATEKVVLIYSDNWKLWFLPKGRKDVGESLEQTALREAYEESGYRAQFLPLNIPTRAPNGPGSARGLNTEPIYVATQFFERTRPDDGGEYVIFWYVAYIGPDAIFEQNTRMEDEKDFVTHLMSCEDAIKKLKETGGEAEARVVAMAWRLWQEQRAHTT